MPEKVKTKKGFGGIDPLVIILIITIIAAITTYIIPCGTFDRIKNDAGVTQVIFESFHFTEQTPVMFWEIPQILMEGFASSISMIVLVCAAAAGFEVITYTGTWNAIIGVLLKVFGNNKTLGLWIISLFFTLIAMLVPTQVFIPFVATCVGLALALGYDDFTGTAMLIVTTAVAAHAMPLQAVTVALQNTLGLPVYSATEFRFIILLVLFVPSIWYLVHYANKVHKDPTKSVVYGLGEEREQYIQSLRPAEYPKVEVKHIIVILEVVAFFAFIMWGGMTFQWDNYIISGVMVVMGMVCGLTCKIWFNEQSAIMTKGVMAMTGTVLIIGLATATAGVLKSAGNIDTIIWFLANSLDNLPTILIPVGMLFIIAIINIFVPAAIGKIAMLMPILSPIAQHVGMSQQMLTFTYAFGDGFTNYILPYQSALAGFLESGRVPFGRWMRFMWKLEIIWFAVGIIVLLVYSQLNIGPF